AVRPPGTKRSLNTIPPQSEQPRQSLQHGSVRRFPSARRPAEPSCSSDFVPCGHSYCILLSLQSPKLARSQPHEPGHPNLLVRAHVGALRCHCLCLRFFRFQNTFAVLGFCFCSSVGRLLYFSAGPLAPTSLSRFHFAARWRLISLSPFTTIG